MPPFESSTSDIGTGLSCKPRGNDLSWRHGMTCGCLCHRGSPDRLIVAIEKWQHHGLGNGYLRVSLKDTDKKPVPLAAVFNYTVLFVLTWLPLSTPNVMFEKTQPHTSSHFQSEGTGFGICVYINERKIGKMFCYQDRFLIWLAPRHHRYAHRSTRPQFANDL